MLTTPLEQARKEAAETPLDKIDVSIASRFGADTHWPFFDRLRAEDPVHYCADSPFGAYWSISRFEDVKFVDTHHDLFSSDIMNGGIRLGGRPMTEPPNEMFHLPMFIMQDQPLHDE